MNGSSKKEGGDSSSQGTEDCNKQIAFLGNSTEAEVSSDSNVTKIEYKIPEATSALREKGSSPTFNKEHIMCSKFDSFPKQKFFNWAEGKHGFVGVQKITDTNRSPINKISDNLLSSSVPNLSSARSSCKSDYTKNVVDISALLQKDKEDLDNILNNRIAQSFALEIEGTNSEAISEKLEPTKMTSEQQKSKQQSVSQQIADSLQQQQLPAATNSSSSTTKTTKAKNRLVKFTKCPRSPKILKVGKNIRVANDLRKMKKKKKLFGISVGRRNKGTSMSEKIGGEPPVLTAEDRKKQASLHKMKRERKVRINLFVL